MNARIYDPLLGRFLSQDPEVTDTERMQNFNRYSYVLNNPLAYTDPSGEAWDKVGQHPDDVVRGKSSAPYADGETVRERATCNKLEARSKAELEERVARAERTRNDAGVGKIVSSVAKSAADVAWNAAYDMTVGGFVEVVDQAKKGNFLGTAVAVALNFNPVKPAKAGSTVLRSTGSGRSFWTKATDFGGAHEFGEGVKMKSRIFRLGEQNPQPTPLAISIPEIALIFGYFFAVWLIPISWLDTAVGAIALLIASKVNPYLSEFSIAFSTAPQYFIHCHVLATWLIPTFLPYLIIKRNGGRREFSLAYRQKIDQFGGWLTYLTLSTLFFGLLFFLMVWLVDYPLTGGERAIWISAVAPSSLMISGVLGLGVMQIYMIFFSIFSNREIKK